jgi:uncharacterized membrane protein YdjX (TVP38/TMEM64 family)
MRFASGDPPTALAAAAGARARYWWGLLVLVLFLAAVQLVHPHALLPGLAERVREAGWLGLFLIGLLYVPAALTAVPVAILSFTAGWLFGPAAAFLVAVPATTVSACAAFGVGRVMAGDPRFLAQGDGRIARAARALESRRGFWTVVLLRLSPVTPFAVLNFAFGATPIRLSTYALATLLGSIPASLGFAIAGAMLGGG